jgi:superfamily II DNA or RNA helicase
MHKFININESNIEKGKSQIDSRGYSILKEFISDETLKNIRKELNLVPKVSKSASSYNTDVSKPAKCYKESPSRIYMPKFYGIKKFGIPKIIMESEGLPLNSHHAKFNGTLRPFQAEKHPKIFKTLEKDHGGIIQWGCGCGKTVYGIYLISLFKRKAIILCHTSDLLNQWKERIEQFMPNARIGRIQASILDYKEKDIVLATIQSISMKDYDPLIFQEFGTVIIDEVHHIAASSFSQALFKMSCKFKIGLSATPKRPDGLDKLLNWTLGNVLDRHVQESKAYVKILNITHDYKNVEYNYRNEINYAAMKQYIAKHEERNKMGINEIVRIAPFRNRIIVISSLRKHCEELYDELCRQGLDAGLYYGNMKAVDLKDSKSRKVIVGTFSMIEEGFDADSVNTVVLFSSVPRNEKLEQSIGRAFREDRAGQNPFESPEAIAMGNDIDYSKLSKLPMILSFNDDIPPFKWASIRNIKFFESKGYKVEHEYDKDSLKNLNKQSNKNSQLNDKEIPDLAIFSMLKPSIKPFKTLKNF